MDVIFDAYDQLIEVCRVAVPDGRIDDGMPVEWPEEQDGMQVGVIVGWSPEGDAPITASVEREGLAGDDRLTYRIRCSLYASYGDDDLKPVRDTCRARFNAVAEQLRVSHPLAKGVLRAWVEFTDFAQAQTADGASTALQFTVAVDAFG